MGNWPRAVQGHESLQGHIVKAEEKPVALALDGERYQEADEYVNVCQSGLMMYRETHDKLFEHQKEGVSFLYSLHRDGREGGILADDMGLGKTIQVIAFLSGMFDGGLVRSVLLVMPVTLVNNWMREFVKWAPGIRVKIFHGTSRKERSQNLEPWCSCVPQSTSFGH
uniref:SNF2 N-terminal domain-containing protein n=1 Tax=Varanus komodoensis TaxID=61221 RepID=A0A8D2IW51_VARKO